MVKIHKSVAGSATTRLEQSVFRQHGSPNFNQGPQLIHFFIFDGNTPLSPVRPTTGPVSVNLDPSTQGGIHGRNGVGFLRLDDGLILFSRDQALLIPSAEHLLHWGNSAPVLYSTYYSDF